MADAGGEKRKGMPGGGGVMNWRFERVRIKGTVHLSTVNMHICCAQGIRTYVATNHSVSSVEQGELSKLGESWGVYPDDKPLHTLALKGDSRAALAPFLAFKYTPPPFPPHPPNLPHRAPFGNT